MFDDFHEAAVTMSDPDIAAVNETLQLGQDAILADVDQLSSQLVGRLYQVRLLLPLIVVVYTKLMNSQR